MKLLISFWKTIVCGIIILILSAMPGKGIPNIQIPSIDKVVHLFMYFGLGLALIHDFVNYSKIHLNQIQIILLSFVCVVAFGGFLEILQRIPFINRSSDFFDFLADATGAIIASFVYKWFSPLLDKINSIVIKR